MKLYDNEYHFKYFRMTHRRFDKLVQRLSPYLKRAKTHANPVGDIERVAVTLRILATGDSQQTVAMSFRLGITTVHEILYQTCGVIWECLSEEYLSPQ